MRRINFAASVAAFALLLVAPAAARACTCASMPGARPCSTFWGAPVVFVGLVSEFVPVAPPAPGPDGARQSDATRVARFNVEESFRGLSGATAQVLTGSGGGDCGYEFKVGARYLVHAWVAEDGRLLTSICSQTKPFEQAAAEVEYARGLARARPVGTVYGSAVFNTTDDPLGDKRTREVLSAAKVVVESEGGDVRRETETDAGGKYEVTDLPAGTYSVRLSTPRYEGPLAQSKPFKLEEMRCKKYDFMLTWEGRVGGRLTDERGEPVRNAQIYLVPAGTDLKGSDVTLKGVTGWADGEGRYEFRWVPPGRYLLVFNPTGELGSNEHPYTRTFHPGTEDPALAGIITVGEHEKVEAGDMRLARGLVRRDLTGTVVWPDGSPAAEGTSVFLYSASETWRQVGEAGRLAEDGGFTVKGWEGGTFLVIATVNMEGGRQMCAGPVEVTLRGEVAPVRLVVKRTYGNCLANYKRDPAKQ